jgi:O-antigen ligase
MNAQKALTWVVALLLGACLFAHTISLRLLLLALGIVLAGIVVARNREVHALPPIWIAFALWAAWAALSLVWSVEPERTVKEWRSEVFYAGATLWVCFVAAQARGSARILTPVLGLAAVAACAVALYSASTGWVRYQQGFHGGPGNHSSALLMLMPCLLFTGWVAARRESRWVVAVCGAITALFLASAYATLTRTLWVGFAIELIVLGGWLLLRTRRAVALRTGMVAIALLLGAGIVVLNIQADREAMGAAGQFDQDPRFTLWSEALQQVRERPLIGYGFGRGMLRQSLNEKFNAPLLWHTHNLFLETVVQLGILGLFLLLFLLGAIAREAWRFACDADELRAACGIVLIAVMAGILVRNATDVLLVRQNALLFWGLTGVLLAWGERSTHTLSARIG